MVTTAAWRLSSRMLPVETAPFDADGTPPGECWQADVAPRLSAGFGWIGAAVAVNDGEPL